MKITVKKLSELHKPAHNIRRHSEKQLTEYIRSIEMFGQVKPLVVAEDGEIIAGNGLYEALLRMGRETCDCYVMVGLTDVQKKKLMMADNKVYELGFTDVDAIEELVKELDGDVDVPGWDADLLEMLNSTEDEADEMIGSYGEFPESEISSINRQQNEEHVPYAAAPTYPVAPSDPQPVSTVSEPPQQPSPVLEVSTPTEPETAVPEAASLYNANAELAHLQKIGVKDVCVLWCGSTLQNNKAWLSTTVPDCMYYEATYDGDKKELRLDAYRKIQSVSIPC